MSRVRRDNRVVFQRYGEMRGGRLDPFRLFSGAGGVSDIGSGGRRRLDVFRRRAATLDTRNAFADNSSPLSMGARKRSGPAPEAVQKAFYLETPSGHVLAVLPPTVTEPSEDITEALLAARHFAREDVALVCLVSTRFKSPGALKADRLIYWPDTLENQYSPEGWAHFAAEAINHLKALRVVLPSGDGHDLACRIGLSSGRAVTTDVVYVDGDTCTRFCANGLSEQDVELSQIVTILAAPFADSKSTNRKFTELVVDASDYSNAGIECLGVDEADAATVDLREAAVVFGAGNGIRDITQFTSMSKAFNASVGASRVVCDNGLVERSRQIGASGLSLDADLYVAFGISGAVQHLQGIEAVKTVIAVNSDPHAAIFKRADISIVTDANALVDEFVEQMA